jgi:hypothetical protein
VSRPPQAVQRTRNGPLNFQCLTRLPFLADVPESSSGGLFEFARVHVAWAAASDIWSSAVWLRLKKVSQAWW